MDLYLSLARVPPHLSHSGVVLLQAYIKALIETQNAVRYILHTLTHPPPPPPPPPNPTCLRPTTACTRACVFFMLL